MTVALTLTVLLVLAVAGFVLGRRRAVASAQGNIRVLHSLPNYYGWHGAIMAAVPALLALAVWLILQPMVVERQVLGYFPADSVESDAARTLIMADVRRVANGLDVAVARGALTDVQAREVSTTTGSIRSESGLRVTAPSSVNNCFSISSTSSARSANRGLSSLRKASA